MILLQANPSFWVGQIAGIPYWQLAVMGIVLIIATIVFVLFLKKLIENIIIGLIVWAIVHFVFKISLPFLPTLILTIFFGMGGIGAMVLAKLFGFG